MAESVSRDRPTAGSREMAERESRRIFHKLVLDASLSEVAQRPLVERMLAEHFGAEVRDLAVSSIHIEAKCELVPFQASLDAHLGEPGRTHELIGLNVPVSDPRLEITLGHLLTPESLPWGGVSIGAPEWEERQSGYQRWLRCLRQGLVLARDEAGPVAIWIASTDETPLDTRRWVTVVAPDATRARQVLSALREGMSSHSPFVGQMFRGGWDGWEFLRRPEPMRDDDVVLAPGLLERIEHHAIGVTLGAKRLRRVGLHLKRGLLLYGPPGTGKTHTLRFLASRAPADTTIAVVNPMDIWTVQFYLPYLGPSAIVLLDDVDQIATARTLPRVRSELFDLLEALDGLHGHGDVLFVLTTNRLAALEPAVSARPGRIDEAIEIPRPDADCRRRLFALSREGMDLRIDSGEIDEIVRRTDGVTGSFFKELLRRSTLLALERVTPAPTGGLAVSGREVLDALDDMLDPSNPTTRLLLGAEPEHAVKRVILMEEGKAR